MCVCVKVRKPLNIKAEKRQTAKRKTCVVHGQKRSGRKPSSR